MFKVKDGLRVGATDVIDSTGQILTTSANALALGGKSPSFYANATNLTTGALSLARLPVEVYTTQNLSFGTGLTVTNGVVTASASGGSVTSVAFTNANGITGTISNPTTTPTLTLNLGDISPSSIRISASTSAITPASFQNNAITPAAWVHNNSGAASSRALVVSTADSTASSIPFDVRSNNTAVDGGSSLFSVDATGRARSIITHAGEVYVRPHGTTGNGVLSILPSDTGAYASLDFYDSAYGFRGGIITGGGIPFYVNGTNGIIFRTNAAQNIRMTIADNGNVGIGTAQQGDIKFAVQHAPGSVAANFSDNSQYTLQVLSGGSGVAKIGGTAGSALAFMANSTEFVRITNDGNVGVGTSSPQSKLHVAGSGAPLTINSTNSNGNKIVLQSNGTNIGYLGGSAAAPFQVQDTGGNNLLNVDTAGKITTNSTYTGSITVANGVTAYGNITLSGPVTASSLTTQGGLTVGNGLTAYGPISLGGAVSMQSVSTTFGMTAGNGFTAYGNIALSGPVSASADVGVGGRLTAASATINGPLVANGGVQTLFADNSRYYMRLGGGPTGTYLDSYSALTFRGTDGSGNLSTQSDWGYISKNTLKLGTPGTGNPVEIVAQGQNPNLILRGDSNSYYPTIRLESAPGTSRIDGYDGLSHYSYSNHVFYSEGKERLRIAPTGTTLRDAFTIKSPDNQIADVGVTYQASNYYVFETYQFGQNSQNFQQGYFTQTHSSGRNYHGDVHNFRTLSGMDIASLTGSLITLNKGIAAKSYLTVTGNVAPESNNIPTLGESAFRWNKAWIGTGGLDSQGPISGGDITGSGQLSVVGGNFVVSQDTNNVYLQSYNLKPLVLNNSGNQVRIGYAGLNVGGPLTGNEASFYKLNVSTSIIGLSSRSTGFNSAGWSGHGVETFIYNSNGYLSSYDRTADTPRPLRIHASTTTFTTTDTNSPLTVNASGIAVGGVISTTGSVTVGGALVAGDITASRGANTGVVFLGSNLTHYLYFDGSTYIMPNGQLLVQHGGASFNGNISATNFSGSSSGTNTGDQTNIPGNAATATVASSLTNFIASNLTNPVAADSVAQNVIGYVNSNISLLGQSDGALYGQAHNSNWQHQIYGDYRTGQIVVRGKNNGTWQAWRTVLDASNYNSYAPSLTGTGASGTWSISVTGNAASATNVAWSGITSKPTTVAGYGITDAVSTSSLGSAAYKNIGTSGNSIPVLDAANTWSKNQIIDQGNQTNVPALYLNNLGAGTSGLAMNPSSGGAYQIYTDGNRPWEFASTNRGQRFTAINSAYDSSPSAFLFANQDADSRSVVRLKQNNSTATGNLLEGVDSANNIKFSVTAAGAATFNYLALSTSVGVSALSASAEMRYNSAYGLMLIGAGSSTDLLVMNKSGATAFSVPAGTTNLSIVGNVTAANLSGTNTGDQTNIPGNAATATNVAWTGVTGRPTAVSAFTNDMNYQGPNGTVAKISYADTRGVTDLPQDKTGYAVQADFKNNTSVANPPVQAGNGYSHVLSLSGWGSAGQGGGGQTTQISTGDGLAVRQSTSGTAWGPWRTMLHDSNFNTYAPSLTGTGASGTWSINITGTASTATNVAWSGITGKPTTIAGYGITDAVSTSSLGSAAYKNTGTSGNTVPLLDGANTWSNNQSITSPMTAWSASTPGTQVGNLHVGTSSSTGNAGPAITFGARDASGAQAGIYLATDGGYGTKLYFATTNSYATGSITAMSIDHTGAVAITRAGLTVAGSISASNLGTAASKNTGTSGNTVPLLDGANTWSGVTTFAENVFAGPTAVTNTATPKTLSFGGSYSGSTRAVAKLKMFDASGLTYGFGISSGQFDYIAAEASSAHVFYVNANNTEALRINGSGITVAGTITASTLTGNAGSATKLATARTISASGDIAWSLPFDGTGNVTASATLATVNSSPGTFGSATSIPAITVNAKGLVTSVGSYLLSPAFLNRFVPTAGQTAFALTQNVGSASDIIVTRNGQRLDPGNDYTVSGTVLTISGSATTTDEVIIAERGGVTAPTVQAPQVTYLTSGAGTYTVPAGAAYLEIEMRGGGAGGSGSGGYSGGSTATPAPGNGSAGSATTFGSSLLTANGGGAPSGRYGGVGGLSTGGDVNRQGALGGTQRDYYTQQAAGHGGGEGGGWSKPDAAGEDATPNSGAGGSGAGTNTNREGGGGGGQGGYLSRVLTGLSGSYAWNVGNGGSGGSAGANGYAGGAGAKGWIKITARFA